MEICQYHKPHVYMEPSENIIAFESTMQDSAMIKLLLKTCYLSIGHGLKVIL